MSIFGNGSGWKIDGNCMVFVYEDKSNTDLDKDPELPTESLRQVVCDAIIDSEEDGLTEEEISKATGLSYETVKVNRMELTSNKIICTNGKTRKGRSGTTGKVHIFSLNNFMSA